MRALKKTGIVVLAVVGVFLTVATTMVLLPGPTFSTVMPESPAPWSRSNAEVQCAADATTRCFKMRDGGLLHARWFGSESQTTVVLLHGILSFGGALEQTANMLRDSTHANVVTIDLRGHGSSAGTPGDLNYIGQYEDDVADVINAIHQEKPGDRIVLAGHSMGGGIAMRYATRADLPKADGYLLFAPHFGQQSPTTRTESTNAAGNDQEPGIKVHLSRTIGLLMLNAVGVSALNDRDTLFFNLPPNYPIHRYTYRAMMSSSPRDYVQSLSADAKPLLVIVGRNDEAFHAENYPAAVALHRNGKAIILDNESHQTIIRSPAAFVAIRSWFTEDLGCTATAGNCI